VIRLLLETASVPDGPDARAAEEVWDDDEE